MTNGLTVVNEIEQLLINGDLSKLQPNQRLAYYKSVCDSLGLNPLTKPFDYITLNGKLTLYAKRDATDQLRKIHRVSITSLERELSDDIYVVIAHAQDKDGRIDTAIGAVNVAGLKGDARANAIMKCETKAKRRVTLSIVGLGWLDETEIETIPDAKPHVIDTQTGEVIESEASHPERIEGQPTKPNGNGGNGHTQKPADKPYRFPSTAGKNFFDAVQKATDNFYADAPDLLKVIGGWFNFGSEDLWNEKLSMAVDHARIKRQSEQVEVEDQSEGETA